ncbi:N66 matrix protein-like [Chenopodium quinoa]|uniref:N66 matrix protein-like n=1 Tax=Chenopodium quinoa TaxID=63459 RepID=UPI000B792D64|nr:N66 matrix protein-like [Chenopodium quinoa]
MTLIKAKLKSASSNATSLPSHIKGRVTSSNSTPPSTSSNMPSGCVFCDVCGSYDHDTSSCPHAFENCDDVENNDCEQVNFVSNNNNGQRFESPRNFGTRNAHQQGSFDNYNSGGYWNQGNQGFGGNYNNQGYSNQNQGQGYGNQGQSQGFGGQHQNYGNNQGRGNSNNQNRGNFQNNNQRGPPPGFSPRPQGNGDNSYAQPPYSRTNLEEIIETQTNILSTYMAVSDKKFNEMMTHN